MKHKLTLFLLLIFSSSYGQGIAFQELGSDKSFKNILENLGEKLLFVDFYTVWCGPCKEMDKKVFPNKNIGDKVNADFISLKVDAEKGEGKILASKYHVVTYPTYLFFNSKGAVIYRTNGSMPMGEFDQHIKNAVNESKQTVTVLDMESLYLQNKSNKDFLYDYLKKRTALKFDNCDLLDDYTGLLDKTEQSSLKTLQLIADNGNFFNRSLKIGKSLNVLIENKEKLKALKKAESIDSYIERAIQKNVELAVQKNDYKILEAAFPFNKNSEIFDNNEVLKLQFFRRTKRYKEYYKTSENYIKNYIGKLSIERMKQMDKKTLDGILSESDSKKADELKKDYGHTQSIRVVNLYNEINDYILRTSKNKLLLSKTLNWSKRSLEICSIDPYFFRYVYPHGLSTHGQSLYLNNLKAKGVSYQQMAYELVLKNDKIDDEANSKPYLDVLNKMKAGKGLF